jgi:hypothetical protein
VQNARRGRRRQKPANDGLGRERGERRGRRGTLTLNARNQVLRQTRDQAITGGTEKEREEKSIYNGELTGRVIENKKRFGNLFEK